VIEPPICLQADALGQHLRKSSLAGHDLEGLVFSSTAVRARDTARIALEHVAVSSNPSPPPALPTAAPGRAAAAKLAPGRLEGFLACT
jgi:phosphohistidine phosphatase SixA